MREVHTTKSPFNLANSVPPHSVKTVVDAWNGYHAIPVKEADRKYLTFATSLGLFRYKRAPQGFLSSGDGYNRRLDELTAHIARCVDDSLLHDKDTDVNLKILKFWIFCFFLVKYTIKYTITHWMSPFRKVQIITSFEPLNIFI